MPALHTGTCMTATIKQSLIREQYVLMANRHACNLFAGASSLTSQPAVPARPLQNLLAAVLSNEAPLPALETVGPVTGLASASSLRLLAEEPSWPLRSMVREHTHARGGCNPVKAGFDYRYMSSSTVGFFDPLS